MAAGEGQDEAKKRLTTKKKHTKCSSKIDHNICYSKVTFLHKSTYFNDLVVEFVLIYFIKNTSVLTFPKTTFIYRHFIQEICFENISS